MWYVYLLLYSLFVRNMYFNEVMQNTFMGSQTRTSLFLFYKNCVEYVLTVRRAMSSFGHIANLYCC